MPSTATTVRKAYVHKPGEVRPSATNIIAVFDQATVAELSEGMAWYNDAHALAKAISPDNVEAGAGVIAALSPLMQWDRNMMLAVRAFEDGVASGAMPASCDKANQIMAGAHPLSVLGGDKVRNFYSTIADPAENRSVVIDRHAFDVAVGRVTDDKTRGILGRKGAYASYAITYRRAARMIEKRDGIAYTPGQLQAITWCAWRRMKGIS